MALKIVFHVDSLEVLEATATEVDEFMVETFQDVQRLQRIDSSNLEIVYRLQKPLLDVPQEHEFFFQGLKSVFDTYASLKPHFTQQEGEPA